MNISIETSFRDKIQSEDFSCIGAKASINKSKYQFCLLEKMASEESTETLYKELKKFASIRTKIDDRFASFIACFKDRQILDKAAFETLLWQQLQMLHKIDEFVWDERVSRDVNSPSFSFSVAGESYFVVGLCPNHERKYRNFSNATLIFNSHHQFEHLKKINLFGRIQKTVREREQKHSGSINPNLLDLTNQSEAMQYSGFKVSKEWVCPVMFHEGSN
jgi:FPC/CPF motif-containing protein YcgG